MKANDLDSGQELLLRAILADDCGVARLSAIEWLNSTNIDDIDGGSFRLMPLFFKRVMERCEVSTEHYGRIKGIYRYYLYKNNLILYHAYYVAESLLRADIRIMLLKGSALILSGCYPDKATRPMSDLDILVDKDNVESAIKILLESGWKIDEKVSVKDLLSYSHAITLINAKGNQLDLHWQLLSNHKYPSMENIFWDSAEQIQLREFSVFAPSIDCLLLHTIIHGLINNRFPPIRWISDAVLIINEKSNQLDWNRVIDLGVKMEVTIFLKYGLQLVSHLTEGKVPPWVLNKLEEQKVYTEEQIMFRILRMDRAIYPYRAWVIHSNNNRDKKMANRIIRFPKFLKFRLGLNSYFQLPHYCWRYFFNKHM